MNKELIEALNALEKEKEISKEKLLSAIETSLLTACKNHFGKADNFKVTINRETGDFKVIAEKEVVDDVTDDTTQISLADAKMINAKYDIGDMVNIEVKSKDFGRIAIQVAKNVILQTIREEERNVLFDQYSSKEKEVVTGVVQRYVGKNVIINLGKVDATLNESEMVRGETFKPVAREAGSRTKIAVWSSNPDVDPVGACVGINGARVNAVVEELGGEKIDIVAWNENAAYLIENALSTAKVVSVIADDEAKTARVVVPDYQLSLAIGKEGQNARLAAKLTGFKIDIKSESQMKELGEDYMNPYNYEYEEDEYSQDDNYEDEASGTEEQ